MEQALELQGLGDGERAVTPGVRGPRWRAGPAPPPHGPPAPQASRPPRSRCFPRPSSAGFPVLAFSSGPAVIVTLLSLSTRLSFLPPSALREHLCPPTLTVAPAWEVPPSSSPALPCSPSLAQLAHLKQLFSSQLHFLFHRVHVFETLQRPQSIVLSGVACVAHSVAFPRLARPPERLPRPGPRPPALT